MDAHIHVYTPKYTLGIVTDCFYACVCVPSHTLTSGSQIAQSNKEIFKANAEAAKYNAIAIRAKGEAEAAVLAAKYKALGANKEIYLAEMKRDTAKLLYTNLSNFKVVMPTNYIGGGGGDAGKLTTNLDVISGFAALGMMDKTAGK